MRSHVVETEILGYPLRCRPLDVRTPDGLRISAQDWRPEERVGDHGRDVLLIHGISQSHQCWLKQLASPLRERYRFVTYDLRGHGGSDKPPFSQYYRDGARWAGEVQAVTMTRPSARGPATINEPQMHHNASALKARGGDEDQLQSAPFVQ